MFENNVSIKIIFENNEFMFFLVKKAYCNTHYIKKTPNLSNTQYNWLPTLVGKQQSREIYIFFLFFLVIFQFSINYFTIQVKIKQTKFKKFKNWLKSPQKLKKANFL